MEGVSHRHIQHTGGRILLRSHIQGSRRGHYNALQESRLKTQRINGRTPVHHRTRVPGQVNRAEGTVVRIDGHGIAVVHGNARKEIVVIGLHSRQRHSATRTPAAPRTGAFLTNHQAARRRNHGIKGHRRGVVHRVVVLTAVHVGQGDGQIVRAFHQGNGAGKLDLHALQRGHVDPGHVFGLIVAVVAGGHIKRSDLVQPVVVHHHRHVALLPGNARGIGLHIGQRTVQPGDLKVTELPADVIQVHAAHVVAPKVRAVERVHVERGNLVDAVAERPNGQVVDLHRPVVERKVDHVGHLEPLPNRVAEAHHRLVAGIGDVEVAVLVEEHVQRPGGTDGLFPLKVEVRAVAFLDQQPHVHLEQALVDQLTKLQHDVLRPPVGTGRTHVNGIGPAVRIIGHNRSILGPAFGPAPGHPLIGQLTNEVPRGVAFKIFRIRLGPSPHCHQQGAHHKYNSVHSIEIGPPSYTNSPATPSTHVHLPWTPIPPFETFHPLPPYFSRTHLHPGLAFHYFCRPLEKGSGGRAVRQWSAKPCTAVRIRSRPQQERNPVSFAPGIFSF